MERILFINSSPEKNGNTARLAAALLEGHSYEMITLADYRINSYGSTLPGDQFDEILEKIKKADVVVLGSPVYWHNLSGGLRVLLDRFYGQVPEGSMHGKKLFLVYQGAAPTKAMLESGEYTISRFGALYGMHYEGMATTLREARTLSSRI
ncbi:flavodoxin family protein [Dubosiella newyorkensis]|uniref:flavodoxin family protein n=1 Tax=Dubosiella newyorkensis TaxID=1862672 RepID=UPI0023EFCE0D|nr:NAD(P)H-dependent oxidoreductase [Dubosiella newyorkensis]